MELSVEFRMKIRDAVMADRKNYSGNDSSYSKRIGVKPSIYSRLKSGEVENILSITKWFYIARLLDVKPKEKNTKIARTKVYTEIEDAITFCQEFSKSKKIIDECGIGKSFSAKHIASKKKNVFYIDCSQCKKPRHFTKTLARTIGVDDKGTHEDVKAMVKSAMIYLGDVVGVLDEVGDVEYNTFLEMKEYWNGTEGYVGWILIGAEGFKAKLEKGKENKKVGFAEIMDRFFDEVRITPLEKNDKKIFINELLTDVAIVNVSDKSKVNRLVKKCMKEGKKLRYLDTLININEGV